LHITQRDILLVLALVAVVAALYLAQPDIGPLFATAAIILVAGEALISVIDDAKQDRDADRLDQPAVVEEKGSQQSL
jgi:hypothetical protein